MKVFPITTVAAALVCIACRGPDDRRANEPVPSLVAAPTSSSVVTVLPATGELPIDTSLSSGAQASLQEMQFTPTSATKPLRRRVVKINVDAVSRLQKYRYMRSALSDFPEDDRSLDLDLFDDARYTGVLDSLVRLPNGGESWSGSIPDVHGSFVVQRAGARITGTVRIPGKGYFELIPWGDSTAIEQIDVRNLREGLPPIAPPTSPPQPVRKRKATAIEPMSHIEDLAPPPTEDGSRIDILVAFTPAARAAAAKRSRAPLNSESPIRDWINQAVFETNQGYKNSHIATRLNLVDVVSTSYIEPSTGTGEMAAILPVLARGPSLLNVRQRRDAMGADVVALMVVGSEGGLSYTMVPAWVNHAFESYAFSVVEWEDAVRNLNLAHETGHVMGSQHDRQHANGGVGAYTYSYGWYLRVNNADYHDIMSYRQSNTSTPINYFANPNVQYPPASPMAVPTGRRRGLPDEADVATTLNTTRVVVANFRSPK